MADMENQTQNSPGRLKIVFNAFLLAVSFLTRYPAKPKYLENEKVWAYSTAFYPFCGFILALSAGIPLFIFLLLAPEHAKIPMLLLIPFLYVFILEWMTRMLHFDGFCDCCDAFAAMGDKEKRLQIMKDPHIGSGAVCSAILLISGKIIFIFIFILYSCSVLAGKPNIALMAVPMIAIPVLARFSMLSLAATGNYPREKGTAFNIVGKVPAASFIFGLLTVIPVLIMIWKLLSIFAVVFCIIAVILPLIYWKIKSANKIGGVSGDVLGAVCETTEFFAAAALLF